MLVGNVTAIGTANAERYAETLKAEVALLGLQNEVFFAGWRNDVAAILHAGDVYAHSASWEGLPLAMCEALAARKAFIGTDCFGIPQGWRQGEMGWFVPKEDPAALGAAMKEVAGLSAERRREIGHNGRKFSEAHFDIEVVSDQFAAQASQFLARPGRAG